jgi:hypothetical protein
MGEQFTLHDLPRIFIVVPNDDGPGTENLSVVEMSDQQFREWINAKAELEKVPMKAPGGRMGLETRLSLLNYLARNGVKIYKLG